MSKFYIPSASNSAVSTPAYERSVSSEADDEDLDTLPYPRELPRSDFLAPDFDAQTYLSTLRNRHQTLEDLRSDLRERSRLLNQELLDLVNGDYEEFLGLGADLRGGEDQVEGVRVGLLGFRREITGIKKGVRQRTDEAQALLRDRKASRRDATMGRNLLEVADRLAELERRLGIAADASEEDVVDIMDDADHDDSTAASPIHRLRGLVHQYLLLSRMFQRIGPSQPFLLAAEPRLGELKKTILLDLTAAFRNARSSKDSGTTVDILGLFEDLNAESESIRVLKSG